MGENDLEQGGRIRVLLVDDHTVLRDGLRMLLNAEHDMVVVGEAASAAQAEMLLPALQPHVVLMDISMPGTNGLDSLGKLRRIAPDSRFLILTMHDDEGYLRKALSVGAAGYVLKKAANIEVLAAIRAVSQGGTYLHADHKAVLFSSPASEEPSAIPEMEEYARLSPREKEILRLIASGYSNREAAEALFLSEKTVETYKSRLMAKLDLHSRVELVRFALQCGLISP